MRYKVTAIKPVEVLAKVHLEPGQLHLGRPVTHAGESFDWIYLRAGEARDGLVQVLGVMAIYAPNEPAQNRMGKDTVLLPLNEKLPKVYYGLFELENSTIPG